MGAGAVFVLLVVIIVAVLVALAFYVFGASQWRRQTKPPEDGGEEGDGRRPTHKVLDEKGDLVREEYDETPAQRRSGDRT